MYWTLWSASWIPNLLLELRRDGFGVVAGVAVVVTCLVAFAGFLETKPITATGDVGCGVVAAVAGEGVAAVAARLVAFASFSGQEVGTECYYGDDEGRE